MFISKGDLYLYQVKLYIKYMVSLRCKLLVKDELKAMGLHPVIIELGDVEIFEQITEEQREQLDRNLRRSGLELMDDKKAILVERIKHVVIETIHYADEALKMNFSNHLTEKLGYDYTYLSNLFAETTGLTLQQYIIRHKIERVKELMIYDELSLTEIAYRLHYSSVAHLSNQFKSVTGLTPTFFKQLKHKRLGGQENV